MLNQICAIVIPTSYEDKSDSFGDWYLTLDVVSYPGCKWMCMQYILLVCKLIAKTIIVWECGSHSFHKVAFSHAPNEFNESFRPENAQKSLTLFDPSFLAHHLANYAWSNGNVHCFRSPHANVVAKGGSRWFWAHTIQKLSMNENRKKVMGHSWSGNF
jgi:hypothetical protein